MTNVTFSWPGTPRFTVHIPDWRLAPGGRLLLVGPSGSGKSTFLALLCGIVVPQSGAVLALGEDVATMAAGRRDRFRVDHFGIIYQMFNLLPYGSVIDNVMLPLYFSPARRARVGGGREARREAGRLLTRLGLPAPVVEGARASQLSVGQQQRVAAARALIGRPEIIVADEPTSALDRNSQMGFLDLLFREAEEAGSSVIMVSHDESLASRFEVVAALDEIVLAERGPNR